jgi:hypothetical protein
VPVVIVIYFLIFLFFSFPFLLLAQKVAMLLWAPDLVHCAAQALEHVSSGATGAV